LEESGLGKVVNYKTPRFVRSRCQPEQQFTPLGLGSARVSLPGPTERDGCELREEHAPGVELVRPKARKIAQLAGRESGKEPWQRRHPATPMRVTPGQDRLCKQIMGHRLH
jgi:hypothetical protein